MMMEACLESREVECTASGNVNCGDDLMDVDDLENQEDIHLMDLKFRLEITHKR